MKPDKSGDRPEVYAVQRGQSGWALSRRSLLGTAAAVAAAAPRRAEGAACGSGGIAHKLGADSIYLSPDGRLLLSHGGGNSYSLATKLWSLPDGALLKIVDESFSLASAAFSPDSRLLALGVSSYLNNTFQLTVQLRSLPDGALVKTIPAPAYPNWLAISPDGQFLIAAGTTTIWFLSLPDGAPLKTIPTGDKYSMESAAISPDWRILALGVFSYPAYTLELRSLPDAALLKAVTGTSRLAHLAISPDGRLLASSSVNADDHTVKLWSLPDAELVGSLTGHSELVQSVAFSPDGRLLASGSADGTIKLWSLPDKVLLKTLTGHSGVVSVAISPDGRLLISAGGEGGDGKDGTIRLWSLPDGTQLPVCLMDPAASDSSLDFITYTGDGGTHTTSCGSIPPGFVCTCNCVPGTGCSCVSNSGGGGGGGGGGGCSCIPVTYWYPN